MNFLQSKLFAALLGSFLFLLTTAFLTVGGLAPSLPLRPSPNADFATGPSWAFFNPELDQLVAELKAEKVAAAAQQEQLLELGARLRAERAELDQTLIAIKSVQAQVDREVFRIRQDEAGNLRKLAKMYAAMEPASAASILRQLDDVVVVKTLALMKEPESALVLESFVKLGAAESTRAAALAEYLRAAASFKPSANK